MDSHHEAVSSLSASIRKFYARKEPFRIYHGSTNSTRQSQFQRDKMVDTSGLCHILSIDIESQTALVEPNVPMDALVEATFSRGLVPSVVMEFPGITVGGGFAGTSGESSSFRYGLFEHTINSIEIVLANGDIVNASSAENSDLFYGAASSFGTLGVTTLLEVQLIKAKKYVELTYQPVFNISEAQDHIEIATKDTSADYLDGIMFGRDNGIIFIGRLTDSVAPGVHVQKFSRRSDPWFYLHTQRLMKNKTTPITEAVPLVDYLFRYDRGAFWVARYSYPYFLTPFNRVTRYLLDHFMHTRVMYHALHKSGFASRYIAQDVGIPYSHISAFMEYLDATFKLYPIWLCPLKADSRDEASTHGRYIQKTNQKTPEMMLNFGVWGPGPRRREDFVTCNRNFEKKIHEFGGQKCLYAHAYYTEEEFYEIYNRKNYDILRDKYHASYLPSVYDKVKVDVDQEKAILQSRKKRALSVFWSIWPLAGVYGVLSAMKGGDYLLPKTSKRK